jgi:hypothetical protein
MNKFYYGGRVEGKSIVPVIISHLKQGQRLKRNPCIDIWFDELLNEDYDHAFNELMQSTFDSIAKATGIPLNLLMTPELKGFETIESRNYQRQILLTWLCARNELKNRARREKINFYRLCRANHLTYPG